MDNVTVSAEDLAGTANYDINTSVSINSLIMITMIVKLVLL